MPFVLYENGRLQLGNGLGTSVIDGKSAHARKLQKQQQRSGNGRASWTNSIVVGGAVGALHELGPNVDVVHEPAHAIEKVTPVGKADEGLRGAGAIEFEAEFEIVRVLHNGHVVIDLEPGVVIRHRNKERLAKAVAGKTDAGVWKRTVLAGKLRPAIVPRTIFPGVLRAKLIQHGRRNGGVHCTVEGVGEIAFNGVRAAAIGLHVESPVLLPGVRVVVAKRNLVLRAGNPIDFAQGRLRVRRAADGTIFTGIPKLGGEEVHQHGINARGIVLLGLAEDLLIVGTKEKQLVFLDRAAQRSTELLLRKSPKARAVGKAGGEASPFLILMRGAVKFVGAGFRHHIHESAGTAAELRWRSVGHHLEFADRVQIHRERRALAAALFPKKGVVIVRAINRNVVVDALLPIDGNLIAIGPLHNGNPWGQAHQVEKIASVVGQIRHRTLVQVRGIFYLAGFNDRRFARHQNLLLHLRNAQRNHQRNGLSGFQIQSLAIQRRETGRGYAHTVSSQRQQQSYKAAAAVSGQGAREICAGVGDDDSRVGDRAITGIVHRAFDTAGVGLRLSGQRSAAHCVDGEDRKRKSQE